MSSLARTNRLARVYAHGGPLKVGQSSLPCLQPADITESLITLKLSEPHLREERVPNIPTLD